MGVTWGVSAWFHDAGLSVIKDGNIVFAGHAERYSGVKHDKHLNQDIINEINTLIIVIFFMSSLFSPHLFILRMITIIIDSDYQLQLCRSIYCNFNGKLKFPLRNLAIKKISKCLNSSVIFK